MIFRVHPKYDRFIDSSDVDVSNGFEWNPNIVANNMMKTIALWRGTFLDQTLGELRNLNSDDLLY